ncbi:transglycosylase domain-containing protein [Patescibacteria group bacterium]|nr:transglycosylase domain-containing protein [Patescibacteria group bacterium]MBU1683456.1 transglycosylase domain-containing protein [Patescibacteria group bacterium]MBU1934819.1 transglycosylase domain-containing protein [Patescibacteria group bacterium]
MYNIFRTFFGFLLIVLLFIHLVVVGLFFCPTSKMLNVAMASDIEYIALSEVPEHVRQVFSANGQSALLSDSDSPFRHLMAKILTVKNKRFFDDDERFEFYLNTLNFGGDVIGVQAASNYYFQKPISDLNFDESIVLVNLYKMFK